MKKRLVQLAAIWLSPEYLIRFENWLCKGKEPIQWIPVQEHFNLETEYKKAMMRSKEALKPEHDWVFFMACILGFLFGLCITILMFVLTAHYGNNG